MSAELVTALVVSHAIHSAGETTNVLSKLTRLSSAIDGKKLPKYPMNLDTRPKALALGFGMTAFFWAISYFILRAMNLNDEPLYVIALVSLIAAEAYGTIRLDTFHVRIERIIKKFSK